MSTLCPSNSSRNIGRRRHNQVANQESLKILLHLAFSALLIAGCTAPERPLRDQHDFAVTTCEVRSNDIQLALERVRRYVNRHTNLPASPQYLGVEADVVFPSEVQDLWIKLRASQNATSAHAQYKNNYVDLRCVVIVDRGSLRVFKNQGYVLADVPPRGSVAKIGGYAVLYIGTAR